jgi:hypothetical protein
VRDANGQALGYFYFEEDPGRPSAGKPLTKDEARIKSEAKEKPSLWCCVAQRQRLSFCAAQTF